MSLDFGEKEECCIVNSRVVKSRRALEWTPGFDWRSYGGCIKGEVKEPLALFGFCGSKESGDSDKKSRSREARNTLSGKGCGHIDWSRGRRFMPCACSHMRGF
jgi:hypothetical protein